MQRLVSVGGAALRPPLSALPHGHQCHRQLFASLACGTRSSPFLWRNSYLIFTLNEAFRFLFKAVKLDMKTHVEMSQAYVGVGRGVNRLQNNWTSVDSCASIWESWAAKERVVEIVDLERRGKSRYSGLALARESVIIICIWYKCFTVGNGECFWCVLIGGCCGEGRGAH